MEASIFEEAYREIGRKLKINDINKRGANIIQLGKDELIQEVSHS